MSTLLHTRTRGTVWYTYLHLVPVSASGDVSSVGSLDTLHAADDMTIPTRCPYPGTPGGTVCVRDVSSVGSLDTLHATDGLVDTIPDTSRYVPTRW